MPNGAFLGSPGRQQPGAEAVLEVLIRGHLRSVEAVSPSTLKRSVMATRCELRCLSLGRGCVPTYNRTGSYERGTPRGCPRRDGDRGHLRPCPGHTGPRDDDAICADERVHPRAIGCQHVSDVRPVSVFWFEVRGAAARDQRGRRIERRRRYARDRAGNDGFHLRVESGAAHGGRAGGAAAAGAGRSIG